jgi:flagellar hook-associated protein 2
MNTSLSATEARLRAQYQALDTQMSTMTGLSSYMNAQLAALSKTA